MRRRHQSSGLLSVICTGLQQSRPICIHVVPREGWSMCSRRSETAGMPCAHRDCSSTKSRQRNHDCEMSSVERLHAHGVVVQQAHAPRLTCSSRRRIRWRSWPRPRRRGRRKAGDPGPPTRALPCPSLRNNPRVVSLSLCPK